jgi:hypothetical protein
MIFSRLSLRDLDGVKEIQFLSVIIVFIYRMNIRHSVSKELFQIRLLADVTSTPFIYEEQAQSWSYTALLICFKTDRHHFLDRYCEILLFVLTAFFFILFHI